MDLDVIDGLNEIRPAVYRAAMKLLSLQRVCHLDVLSVRHIMAAIRSLKGTRPQQDEGLNREEVTRTLNRMFHSVSQEVTHHVTGHVTTEAPEKTCSLMLTLFDRAGSVSAASLQTALIALSPDSLLDKYRALVSVCEDTSGSISRSGLRCLLQDLSQVPAAVQEDVVFGDVAVAVRSCFDRVLTPTVTSQHVLSWLQSEPRLLLWLPTLYRLYVSQNVSHMVRCHTCKTSPITGLRYRCLKCVKVHVCQSCFMSQRQTRKHKRQHPVLEYCTQPTWRESLNSLVHSARHTLLPWRYTQREANGRRVLMWPEETHNSALPPSDASTPLVESAVCHSPSSEMPTQQASPLTTEVRNLQRDKWLLEQEMQAWRLTVQSEQGILEDRCSGMEVTMETLRRQNVCVQGLLTQTLNKMEAQQRANDTERGEEEEEEVLTDDSSEDGCQTPSPTIHRDMPPSHAIKEEGPAGDGPIGRENGPEEARLHEEETCLSGEEVDCGMCSPEELVQQTVDMLKTVMEKDMWRERQKGERKGAELLEAADQVGDAVQHLVDAVRTTTH
ncbi:dystrotelin isoform X2 [Scophthalmus maximus]|uniref:dystrotelin isoform X2 n=1 Tax=Scophthalmus maximus TaxID=52904 RepID=UPI001FA84655|nr:dystrotelin isoform X2 [Scophthalmus maximus]